MDKYDCLKLDNQLCFPLYVASKELVRRYKPFLDKIDLTYTQYIAMMVMWEKKKLKVTELCKCLYLDTGTISPLVRKLKSKGYITLTRDEEDERIQVGDISLDSMAQKVYYKDKHIITTPKEFKVMEFLMTNKNIALKREQILSNVWGDDYNGTDRTVDTIIKQLRIKLGDGGKYIKSIYGMGYIFDESEE